MCTQKDGYGLPLRVWLAVFTRANVNLSYAWTNVFFLYVNRKPLIFLIAPGTPKRPPMDLEGPWERTLLCTCSLFRKPLEFSLLISCSRFGHARQNSEEEEGGSEGPEPSGWSFVFFFSGFGAGPFPFFEWSRVRLDPFCNQDFFHVSWVAREILSDLLLLLFLALGKFTRVRFRLGFFSLMGNRLFVRVRREALVGLEVLKSFYFGLKYTDKKHSVGISVFRDLIYVVYRLSGELVEGCKLFRLGVRGGNAGFYPAPAPSLVTFLLSFFHHGHELLDLHL